MSGTHLFYNGVLMRDCEVRQWLQEIIRDDSGTDVLYSKVTLSVESLLISLSPTASGQHLPPGGFNAPWSTVAVPYVENETIVDRWREVQWRLQETRKDFWLAVNGATTQPQPGRVVPPSSPPGTPSEPPLPADDGYFNDSYRVVLAATGLSPDDLRTLEEDSEGDPDGLLGFVDGFSDAGGSTRQTKILRNRVIDLNNGPKPISVSVEQVFGGRALRVSFTIEICRCFCQPKLLTSTEVPPVKDATKVKGVISNRWSLTESLDAEWRTSHEIEGKLVVTDARYKPHAMRLMAYPSAIPYARLESRSFATDRTGLALAYRFSFKEVGHAAPPGVVDWDGRYTETQAGNANIGADIHVKVVGQANPVNGQQPDIHRSHKSFLLAMAYRIVKSRIRFARNWNPLPGSKAPAIVMSNMVVVEHMKEPVVELNAKVLYSDGDAGDLVNDQFGLRLKNMGASLAETINQYDPRWWPIPGTYPWDVKTSKEASRDKEIGTFYDNYFQSPCSEWHSMPRGAAPPSDVKRKEVEATESTGGTELALPVSSGLVIAVDPSLTATLFDATDPPPGIPIANSLNGFNPSQGQFAYIQADIDTQYDMNSGTVMLPLSKQRSFSAGVPGASAIAVQLHAGLAFRTFRMIATRIGDWPKFPSPVASISSAGFVETLVNSHVNTEPPKLTKDGQALLYSVQVKWVYGLSRIPNQSGDKLRAASSPVDKTTPVGNRIELSKLFDTTGSIETTS